MTTPAIRVENLGKKYLISHQQRERYTALRDVLTNKAKGLGRRIIHLGRSPVSHHPSKEEFWALKEVSFEVRPGERVGIIGRNGAGKSTLLKLLSRITDPSAGRIELHGRIGSLLEVGTGFHPELTGRENIYLNGAILGMSKEVITKRFDEIVAFAEIERFLDTPVKRYSSGMYVRLAFAVAAHLEPDILVVDEVLAVGDIQFQEKCLGKMEEVGSEGRTVLFVSHNMGAIRRLCSRSILLNKGMMLTDGASEVVIGTYLSSDRRNAVTDRLWSEAEAPGDDKLKLRRVRIVNTELVPAAAIRIEEPIIIELALEAKTQLQEVFFSIFLTNSNGVVVLHTCDVMSSQKAARSKGPLRVKCKIPPYCLNTGRYSLDVASDVPFEKVIFHVQDVLRFEVLGTCDKMGRYPAGAWKGVIGPGIASWTSEGTADG